MNEYTVSRRNARKLIEALRLGVVPSSDMSDFTFQRENETEIIKSGYKEVEESGGCIKVILSPYGTGKTHFLNFIQKTALNDGWITSRVDCDMKEKSFTKPRDIYREIIQSLKGKKDNKIYNYQSILKEASRNESIFKLFEENRYIGVVLKTLRRNISDKKLKPMWKWFTGESVPIKKARISKEAKKLRSIQRYSTHADRICNILSGLGLIAKKIGFKGIFIAFDEVENINLLYKNNREKASNFLKGLFFISLGEKTSELNFREDSLIHSKPRGKSKEKISYLFDYPSNLYLVFAMTPQSESSLFDKILDKDRFFRINSLSQKSIINLGNNLLKKYEIAYDIYLNVEDEELEHFILKCLDNYRGLFLNNVRLINKFLIETFDFLRHKKYNSLKQVFHSINI